MASDVLQLMWKLWRLIVHDCYNFCVRGSGFCIKNYWRNKARRRLSGDVPSWPFRGCLLTHPKLRIDFMLCRCFYAEVFLVKIFTSSFGATRHFVERLRSSTNFRMKIFFLVITTRISRKMLMTTTRYHRISYAAFIVSCLSMISFSWKLTSLDWTMVDKRKCFSYKSVLKFHSKHQFSFNLWDSSLEAI